MIEAEQQSPLQNRKTSIYDQQKLVENMDIYKFFHVGVGNVKAIAMFVLFLTSK